MSLVHQWMDGARGKEGGAVGFVLRYWRGEGELATIFWRYGVVGSAALAELFVFAERRDNLVMQQSLILLLAIYTVWIVGSIWRCARRADVDPFHQAARAVSIAWAINTVLLLGFFEVELLARIFF